MTYNFMPVSSKPRWLSRSTSKEYWDITYKLPSSTRRDHVTSRLLQQPSWEPGPLHCNSLLVLEMQSTPAEEALQILPPNVIVGLVPAPMALFHQRRPWHREMAGST